MADVKRMFWDNGGVILTNGWDRDSREKAVEKFHLDWDDFEDRHELMLDAFECGEVEPRRISAEDGFLPRAAVHARRNSSNSCSSSRSRCRSRSTVLAEACRGNGRTCMAALNNESLEINDYRVHKFHLRDYFEAFFSSCYLGVRKPRRGNLQFGAEDHPVRSRGVRADR